MEREIKFRAWNKKKNIMMEPSHNVLIDSYDGCPHFSFGYNEPMPEPNWILMQYTGLKDKNGKEIYEGDVVKDGSVNRVIEWSSHRGNRVVGYFAAFTIIDNPDECLEIIGNRYENPELLK